MNNWVLEHCDLKKIGYPIEIFYMSQLYRLLL